MTHAFIATLPTEPAHRLIAIKQQAAALYNKGASGLADNDDALIDALVEEAARTQRRIDLAGVAKTASGGPIRWQELDGTPISGSHAPAGEVAKNAPTAAFRKAMSTALERDPSALRLKSGILPASGSTTRFEYADALVEGRTGPLTIAALATRIASAAPSGQVLVQTARTNNAASVPVGGYKPESAYTVSPVTWRAYALAHVLVLPNSYLADYSGLAEFVGNELGFGLATALDAALVNGTTDEEGAVVAGLYTTGNGIPVQAFASSALVSIRTALTALEQAGVDDGVSIVLAPSDWQAIEMLQLAGTGGYLFGSSVPGQPAPRLLFGRPVVLSSAVPVGKALVGAFASLLLFERQVITIEAFASGMAREASGTGGSATPASDLARRNETLIRAEGRWGQMIQTPTDFRLVNLAGS